MLQSTAVTSGFEISHTGTTGAIDKSQSTLTKKSPDSESVWGPLNQVLVFPTNVCLKIACTCPKTRELSGRCMAMWEDDVICVSESLVQTLMILPRTSYWVLHALAHDCLVIGQWRPSLWHPRWHQGKLPKLVSPPCPFLLLFISNTYGIIVFKCTSVVTLKFTELGTIQLGVMTDGSLLKVSHTSGLSKLLSGRWPLLWRKWAHSYSR